jgi:hypothetical protein
MSKNISVETNKYQHSLIDLPTLVEYLEEEQKELKTRKKEKNKYIIKNNKECYII